MTLEEESKKLHVTTQHHGHQYDYFVFHGAGQTKPVVTITTARVLILHLTFFQRLVAVWTLLFNGTIRIPEDKR
jgi:hypothetical protein